MPDLVLDRYTNISGSERDQEGQGSCLGWYPSLCGALVAGFSATLSEYSAHMKVRMKEKRFMKPQYQRNHKLVFGVGGGRGPTQATPLTSLGPS